MKLKYGGIQLILSAAIVLINAIIILAHSQHLYEQPEPSPVTQECEPLEFEALSEAYGKFMRLCIENPDSVFIDDLEFESAAVLRQIALGEDPVAMGRMICHASPFGNTMPSGKWSLPYLKMLNDVSMKISQFSPSLLDNPIEEQKAMIRDFFNSKKEVCGNASQFGRRMSEEEVEIYKLAHQVLEYDTAMNIQRELNKHLALGLLQKIEELNEEMGQELVENIGIMDNGKAIDMLKEQGFEIRNQQYADGPSKTDGK